MQRFNRSLSEGRSFLFLNSTFLHSLKESLTSTLHINKFLWGIGTEYYIIILPDQDLVFYSYGEVVEMLWEVGVRWNKEPWFDRLLREDVEGQNGDEKIRSDKGRTITIPAFILRA